MFAEHGIEGTTGEAIAEAAGVSKRTVWRHFRTKEASVEPLLRATGLRFIGQLNDWPRHLSIEDYLRCLAATYEEDEQATRDGVAAVRIIAMMRDHPALRSAWLMACGAAEAELGPVIAARTGGLASDFDIRLCAASVMAGIRVVDEDISVAAVRDGQRFDRFEPFDRLASVIRRTSVLPFCDPVDE